MTEVPTITELFERDPLDLNDRDIDLIIKEFREGRLAYIQGGRQASSTGKKKVEKISPEQAADAKDLLADLGL